MKFKTTFSLGSEWNLYTASPDLMQKPSVTVATKVITPRPRVDKLGLWKVRCIIYYTGGTYTHVKSVVDQKFGQCSGCKTYVREMIWKMKCEPSAFPLKAAKASKCTSSHFSTRLTGN